MTAQLEIERVRGRSSPVTSLSTQLLKLFHPRVDDWCHTIAATYGGGLVSGDRPCLGLRCGPDTRLYLTSPGFTQVYKGEAKLLLDADLEPGSLAVYHGLPLVPHEDSRVSQRSTWRLASGASLVAIDWLLPGRVARGERFRYQEVETELRLERDGRLILLDRLRSEPARHPFGPYEVLLSVTLVGPALEPVREQLEARWNKTLGPSRATTPPERLINLAPLPAEGHQLRAMARERLHLEEVERSVFEALSECGLLTFDPLARRT